MVVGAVRKLLLVVLGAVIVLQFDRWLESKRAQLTPNALTGKLLDSVNDRLERRRSR